MFMPPVWAVASSMFSIIYGARAGLGRQLRYREEAFSAFSVKSQTQVAEVYSLLVMFVTVFFR
jgi:hypothetical protein